MLRAASHVVLTDLGGETVLLDLRTERYFGLDAAAARMWQVLCDAGSVDDACAVLAAEFDVDRATLERDVTALVQQLSDLGLVEIS